MLDTNFIKFFLAKHDLPYPDHILLKPPQESEFLFIESAAGSQSVRIADIPVFEHDLVTEDGENKRSLLWLKYSEQILVVAVFPEAVSLDYSTVNTLYHLLLPVSLVRSSTRLEYRFESIVTSIVELSSTVDFDILINKILEKTLSIVKADAGMLWAFDSGINKLVCRAHKGTATGQALSLQLELGEGLIGKTFLRGTPKLYSSFDEILPDIEDFSAENKSVSMSIFGGRIMDSAFLMPIFVNKQIECIMIVYRLKGNPIFSSSDIETLKIFAELIEMTMTNARSLTTLQTQLEDLEKCNAFYSKLTSLSVNNSGISNIVKELKSILGIPVLVINLLNHEQYPRTAAFERELSTRLTQMNIRNNDAFLIEPENRSAKYRVNPIFVESSCLGYLIARSKENESRVDQMILEIGRMVIALELSKAQSQMDILFKRTAQNFHELININTPLELSKKCGELGLALNADYVVVVLSLLKETSEIQSSSIYRLIATIKNALAGAQRLVFNSQDKITVLLSVQSIGGTHLVHQQVDEIIAQAQKNEKLSLCAGMGSLYRGANAINKSYREAQNALMYQLSRHGLGLLEYPDMGVNQLFINLTSEEATAFLSKVFTPLRENSRTSEYLEATLIAYIESNFSINQTAQKLYIHTNTLYQRLKKIENCLQISFKKPDDLLQIQLACYIRNNYPDIYNSV
jgi:sugar diacid utilization regulator